jgi:hypothetical protein
VLPPVVYFLPTVGASSSTAYIDFNGATVSVPYGTTYGNTFSTTISLGSYGTNSQISKSTLIDILVDYVVDNRDGVIILSTQSILLTGTVGTTVNAVTGEGTYSLKFDFSDIAGNSPTGVILNLTITA